MVVKLNTPNIGIDEDKFIDLVVSERTIEPNKTFFRRYSPIWKERVNEYIVKSGNPELVSNSLAVITSEKTKFINLYSHPSDTSAQKPILDNLRERSIQICPCCGEDGTPNTLDHYLPKDKYPEFSILSKNLFPMCDICQGKKSTKDTDNLNQRIFIHPYYDDFINNQILNLVIEPPYQSPINFFLVVNDILHIDQQNLVNRHITELGIHQRYSKYFRDQYFRILRVVSDIRNNGDDVVVMLNQFARMAKLKSINSWEHIFYSSVINDEDLIHFLCNDDTTKW